jgi:hypothetical protein
VLPYHDDNSGGKRAPANGVAAISRGIKQVQRVKRSVAPQDLAAWPTLAHYLHCDAPPIEIIKQPVRQEGQA